MAAFANRAALITFVTADTQRSDLADSMLTFLALVEADIRAALRERPMIERWTVTIDAEFLAFPTDFAGARTLRLTSGNMNRVANVSADQMADLKARYPNSTGGPQYFCVLGDEFEFFPDPDSGEYEATLTGFLGVPALSSDSSTNWVLEKHPALYLAGMRRYIFRRSRNATEIARADADFATQLDLIHTVSLRESYADDPRPSAAMVV